jgi:hypothetical protein
MSWLGRGTSPRQSAAGRITAAYRAHPGRPAQGSVDLRKPPSGLGWAALVTPAKDGDLRPRAGPSAQSSQVRSPPNADVPGRPVLDHAARGSRARQSSNTCGRDHGGQGGQGQLTPCPRRPGLGVGPDNGDQRSALDLPRLNAIAAGIALLLAACVADRAVRLRASSSGL